MFYTNPSRKIIRHTNISREITMTYWLRSRIPSQAGNFIDTYLTLSHLSIFQQTTIEGFLRFLEITVHRLKRPVSARKSRVSIWIIFFLRFSFFRSDMKASGYQYLWCLNFFFFYLILKCFLTVSHVNFYILWMVLLYSDALDLIQIKEHTLFMKAI